MLIAEAMDYHEKTIKHDKIIEDMSNRLQSLELSYKDTDLMVKKELVTYKMMKVAVSAISQEYDKRMTQYLQEIKDYVQIEIADFITREEAKEKLDNKVSVTDNSLYISEITGKIKRLNEVISKQVDTIRGETSDKLNKKADISRIQEILDTSISK